MGSIIQFPRPTDTSELGQGFYTIAEAARLARVPMGTLRYWRKECILLETIEWEDEEEEREIGYTFDTLVYMRLLRMLRDNDVSLRKAVEGVSSLTDRFGPPGPAWERARLFVYRSDLYVHAKDEWKTTVVTRGGQKSADVLFGDEFQRLRDRADALLVPREFQNRVEIDPAKRNGHPVIVGTTVPTSLVYEMVKAGHNVSEIHREFPFLPLASVKAAQRFEHYLDLPLAA